MTRLLVHLGVLASSLWIILIRPGIAEFREIVVTLKLEGLSSYRSVLAQAESLAQQTLSQAFTNDSELTEVTLTVLGDRNGQSAPLVLTAITREQWQESQITAERPQALLSSVALLGLLEPERSPVAKPASVAPASLPYEDVLEQDPAFRDD
ncbi:hypothetical protein [Sphaerothrix gracilis]|uniref:hypothetical protein n=1 Tax=Sphaerothrix gracilis TaxID=3151835 RepID=UPI0031FC65ED